MPRLPLTFADLIRRSGLTQRAIAVALNKRESTISDWVRRISYPTLTFAEILQLEVLLNGSTEELSLAFDDFSAEDARSRIEQRLRLME
ncbi:MAG: transcriptional regulator [Tildeniella nuda ZEHNDER 1965/U140]|jgi:transcriptional regulator with XRE-family HTH domain|nr:transcriptional regulator [Tildeniella nuda ZEHNDER 1965/U140]